MDFIFKSTNNYPFKKNMPAPSKNSKDKGKTPTQTKLSDYGKHADQRPSKDASSHGGASSISNEADAEMAETLAESPRGPDSSDLMLVKEEILKAVGELRSEFTVKLNGILKASEETSKQLSDCANRIGQAETRLSSVEDDCYTLKAKVEKLEGRNRVLEDKIVDMETRSRSNNVRLVNLPEGAESPDPCAFFESWLPDALDLHLRVPLVLERAHRIGPKRGTGDPPRPLIMKFQNYKQKTAVMEAAKRTDILYKDTRVRLYQDLATEVHKRRKQYDSVRKQLRELGLRHGIRPPATLLVTYRDETLIFNKPAEVEEFIHRVKEERSNQ